MYGKFVKQDNSFCLGNRTTVTREAKPALKRCEATTGQIEIIWPDNAPASKLVNRVTNYVKCGTNSINLKNSLIFKTFCSKRNCLNYITAFSPRWVGT